MRNRHSTGTADQSTQSTAVPWAWLDRRTPAAFAVAGVLLLASGVVPVALDAVTRWAWAAGLILVGAGAVAAAVGLLGLHPRLGAHGSAVSALGVLGAGLAGAAAMGVISLGGLALVGEGAMGMDLGKPMEVFAVVALTMAGGLALGFVSFGVVGVRTESFPGTASRLLLLGGLLLLVPFAGEVLRRGLGIDPGIPGWIFLPVLGVLIVDTLAIGYALRAAS